MITPAGIARMRIMAEVHAEVQRDLKLRDPAMHEAIAIANLAQCFATDAVATVDLLCADFSERRLKLAAAIILAERMKISAIEKWGS